MTKNSLTAAAMALLSVFTLAACNEAPPSRVAADTPEWAESLTVHRVTKRYATITAPAGENLHINRVSQDIGGGLSARTLGSHKLYVTDANGVECVWRAQKVTGCTKPAPAPAAP